MPENELPNANLAPHSLTAERAVLGACLLDARAANQVREQVRVDDFYAPQHRHIFGCISKLVDDGQPCDPVTVSEALRLAGELDACGGMAYISGLLDAVPAPSAAAHYASIVADRAQSRELLAAASQVLDAARDGGMNAAELTDLAERLVFEVGTSRHAGDLHPLSELLSKVYVQMSEIKAMGGVTGVPTFIDLDREYLSGLQKGDLVILAARPGCGKTSMAMNIAAEAAATHKRVVAVFSLEMPKEQLVQRILCTKAQVDHSRVTKGMASKQDFARLQKAVGTMAGAEMYIDDTMSVSVSEMRSKCRKLRMDKGLDLIVVDYIQLMQSTARRSENRQLEVAEISRSLKAMAKEMDVPVLALSQLSRQAEQGKEAPGLAHLRESGALEQDADLVLLLHRNKPDVKEGEEEEAQFKRDNSGDEVDVIVAKHRNGPTGKVTMTFIRQYTAFVDRVQNWAGDRDIPPERGIEHDDVF